MITALYASILAIWICWLVIQVVKARYKHKVILGDGGVDELLIARSAHANAVETTPLVMILLFSFEFNGGNFWLVNLFGVVFVVARLLHSKGILSQTIKYRRLGMQTTLAVILALVVGNLICLPYQEFLNF
ncbi:MAPEG family protein [Marinomonas transparens]|uniref:MAPEG family protein n=1 Tax=Marinomonas transparens TaxID=2795388 RepID=A0A934JSS2_9GAMM|nr:MAPEG family protein [Marinomonas transparens]MBJ7539324.1 MAPEG family protein [Marinomonas transparens]